MRKLAVVVLLFVALPIFSQTTETTVCKIASDPASFDGKTITIKATAISGFDEFVLEDASCPGSKIWLDFPDGAHAKSGPAARINLQLAKNSSGTPTIRETKSVKLEKDKDFKQFDSALSAPYKGSGYCFGCVKNNVAATFTGRIDGVAAVGAKKDASGNFASISGFGNMNLYSARMVLQSVKDVTPQEIDFSKSSKEPSTDVGGGGDPVAGAKAASKAFDPNSGAAKQIVDAAEAFGKEGEDNGVNVGFGIPNEAPSAESRKGDKKSPDALLLDCVFDMDRLKGSALSIAIAHLGTHIIAIRSATGTSLPELEQKAFQTTMYSAIANGYKSFSLPGGILAWSSSWPQADRNRLANEAISKEADR